MATGQDIEFSTEDTASCCKGFMCGLSMGCNGGQPSAALSWMANTGVVTGGDYPDIGKGTTCRPYTLPPCAHHVPATKTYKKCPSNEYPTPRCEKQCSESKYPTSYSDADEAKVDRWPPMPSDVLLALMTIAAAFQRMKARIRRSMCSSPGNHGWSSVAMVLT